MMMESIEEHHVPPIAPMVDTAFLSTILDSRNDNNMDPTSAPSVTDTSVATESILSSVDDDDADDDDDEDDTSVVNEQRAQSQPHSPTIKMQSLKQLLEVHHADRTNLPNTMTRPQIYGHRGAIYQALENTRKSFQVCADMGCDGIELDVFVLKCGTVACFHGCGTDQASGLLHNYCGVEGTIVDYTYEQVKSFSFSPSFAGFVCPQNEIANAIIPTLEDVLLDAKQSGLHAKIELKGKGTVEPTLEVVERLNMVDQVSFSSFYHDRIALLRQLRPQVDSNGQHIYRTGALFSDLPHDFIERARKVGASDIHLRYDTCSASKVQAIHEAGFGSFAWMRGPVTMAIDFRDKFWDVDCENEDMYQAILDTGVQMVCVNKPDIMVKLRQDFDARIAFWAAQSMEIRKEPVLDSVVARVSDDEEDETMMIPETVAA